MKTNKRGMEMMMGVIIVIVLGLLLLLLFPSILKAGVKEGSEAIIGLGKCTSGAIGEGSCIPKGYCAKVYPEGTVKELSGFGCEKTEDDVETLKSADPKTYKDKSAVYDLITKESWEAGLYDESRWQTCCIALK